MIPVYVPFIFIAVVVGGLGLFSKIYRRRQAAQKYEPWFPSHPDRDTYITLLQKTDPPASDGLLKAALLRRAVADVSRAFRIKEDKAALNNLLVKGSIGDDLWNSFLAAEKELEAEIYEVVTEANSYLDGWGSFIFQSASEIVQNEKYREVFMNIPQKRAEIGKTSLPAFLLVVLTHPQMKPLGSPRILLTVQQRVRLLSLPSSSMNPPLLIAPPKTMDG
ncbi:Pre protein translocase subunit Sec66-domain-containing protein [Cantharellus anzutake]|uniref:Pre protein translocase subunit Sec66-domain-containing protein n=1 Tax=Cantharellus anzutake TaxID=1750568 RepID=UPI0019059E61|nr:Pre protein translocase subunit Sec66-domain-containing protein [Cantharellus anzutake]KAF8343946.1 Pre protein translocase subunit Sec66-domain-containing protein [Cantharellus anzutake]